VNRTEDTSNSDRSSNDARRGILWIVAILGIAGNSGILLTPPGYGRFLAAVFLGAPTLALSAGVYLLGRIGHRPLISFARTRPQDRGRLLGVCLLANVVISGLALAFLFFI